MKKFDILDQFQATFDGWGNINGFKRVAVIPAESTLDALEIAKTKLKFPMAMVQPHQEPVKLSTLQLRRR